MSARSDPPSPDAGGVLAPPDRRLPDELEEPHATLERITDRVLAARTPDGHWTGELSSSALSTATATIALALVGRSRPRPSLALLVRDGVAWLVGTQNADGGWGDTTDSPSNVSTTALCWAALAIAGGDEAGHDAARERARDWMLRAAGSLEPRPLGRAISRRYGKDRTFSVPILTVLALAGLLGTGEPGGRVPAGGRSGGSGRIGSGWRHVPQLPFELAAVPPAFYRWLRLPVVSYALPALIAIGQARHRQRPTRNPLARLARCAFRRRTLRRLEAIQPRGGGFLEAAPLTSFVVMSLVAAGEAAHPVVDRGVEFLERSVRGDGSWPIDTNLATWATTLSVNALARRRDWRERIGPRGCAALRRWLLDQQYRERHVYTDAAPGGWAWTDLPGGVPDADDTPGALLALHALGADDAEHRRAACAGIGWLVDLQNADGGIPTFCRGWGALPFDRSSPDLTAHTLRAWTAWRAALPARLRMRTERATRRAVRFLERAQREDGAWIPLWFGNQGAPDDANPVYGTARVLEGLAALPDAEAPLAAEVRAARWLVGAQGSDGGWGGAPGVSPSIEETAVAVSALASVGRLPRRAAGPELDAAVDGGVRWLIDATGGGRQAVPKPIGLYFAKLWYSEALYPWIFALGAFTSLRPRFR
ncbi:MAG: squalene--hopene cyclase [Acidobacteria bacterium]|nr:squalene--hopene cyclase [Acidobacteriota bacterium]